MTNKLSRNIEFILKLCRFYINAKYTNFISKICLNYSKKSQNYSHCILIDHQLFSLFSDILHNLKAQLSCVKFDNYTVTIQNCIQHFNHCASSIFLSLDTMHSPNTTLAPISSIYHSLISVHSRTRRLLPT